MPACRTPEVQAQLPSPQLPPSAMVDTVVMLKCMVRRAADARDDPMQTLAHCIGPLAFEHSLALINDILPYSEDDVHVEGVWALHAHA